MTAQTLTRLRCWLPGPTKARQLRLVERQNERLRGTLSRTAAERRSAVIELGDVRRAHEATLTELDRYRSLIGETVHAWNDCHVENTPCDEPVIYTGHSGLVDTLAQLERAVAP